ncbi:DUF397 domain-containing protein [Streptomyces sp. NPDC057199]|jgi:hypothetical protein|uniref:DUF397 domain-containing protein n=1 Tax=Streptomyces sp. NPDC057199 TaxID=3346047 RepID=UPI0036394309
MHIRATDLPNAAWFKSSYSDNQGGACVEGARLAGGAMAVRDSKVPAGPAFLFRGDAWMTFADAVKTGEFGLPL